MFVQPGRRPAGVLPRQQATSVQRPQQGAQDDKVSEREEVDFLARSRGGDLAGDEVAMKYHPLKDIRRS
jgi:hypothetical protein